MSQELKPNVDWGMIKKIINDAIILLQPLIEAMPNGMPKVILSGILSALHVLADSLPAAQ